MPANAPRSARAKSAFAFAVLAATSLAWTGAARAACRTTTCPLPPSWSPVVGSCYPPSFASSCPTSNPPGGKVLPIFWRNLCVSFDIQKDASRWASYTQVQAIVAGAFAEWTGATCQADASGQTNVSISVVDRGPADCDLVQYNGNQGNQHLIVFRDNGWGQSDAGTAAASMDPVSAGTLGLTTVTFDPDTGEIYDADTEINGTVPLGVGASIPSGSYDLASIITHEMGHFLGLAHSAERGATMYALYSPGSTSMRNLTADDQGGICSIYPPNGTRLVDPSVADGGALIADACNSDPRHGFSTQCGQPIHHGCSIGNGAGRDAGLYGGSTGACALAAGGLAMALARLRKRSAVVRSK
jgi:Matrixin